MRIMHRLDEMDQMDVVEIARRRQYGINYKHTTHFDDKDPLWKNTNSLAAEWAYCRLVGSEVDRSIDGFYPYDTIVYWNGIHKVDVKWTWRRWGCLIVKDKDWSDPPDWFVLMIGNWPEYEYKGRILASKLLARPLDRRDIFKKPGYTARQWELIKALEF